MLLFPSENEFLQSLKLLTIKMSSLQIVFPSLAQLKVNKRNLQYWTKGFNDYSYVNTFYWQKILVKLTMKINFNKFPISDQFFLFFT